MSSKKKAIRQRILESAQIPEDLSRGAVLLQITGREEVYIEKFHGGILEYTDCGNFDPREAGKDFDRRQIPSDSDFIPQKRWKITGQIDQIRYL